MWGVGCRKFFLLTKTCALCKYSNLCAPSNPLINDSPILASQKSMVTRHCALTTHQVPAGHSVRITRNLWSAMLSPTPAPNSLPSPLHPVTLNRSGVTHSPYCPHLPSWAALTVHFSPPPIRVLSFLRSGRSLSLQASPDICIAQRNALSTKVTEFLNLALFT